MLLCSNQEYSAGHHHSRLFPDLDNKANERGMLSQGLNHPGKSPELSVFHPT